MKQRFTFLDIRSITNELSDKLSLKYIQNVYSYQQRLFFIKFSNKDILLIEPGIRFHLVNQSSNDSKCMDGGSMSVGSSVGDSRGVGSINRLEGVNSIDINKCNDTNDTTTNNLNTNTNLNTNLNTNTNTTTSTTTNITDLFNINHFCKIMRKHLRREKLLSIYQIGFDRVVVLEFKNLKLVIEFFSGGNLFILNDNNIIMEVYRPVRDLLIVKNSEYVFNRVEFDFSIFNLFKVGVNEFLCFDKELREIVIENVKISTGVDIMKVGKKIRREDLRGGVNKSLKCGVVDGSLKDGTGVESGIKKNNDYKEYGVVKNNDYKESVMENGTGVTNESGVKSIVDATCVKETTVYEKTNKNLKPLTTTDITKDITNLSITTDEEMNKLLKDKTFIDKFNIIMTEFHNYISNLKGFGVITFKKSKYENVVPYNVNELNEIFRRCMENGSRCLENVNGSIENGSGCMENVNRCIENGNGSLENVSRCMENGNGCENVNGGSFTGVDVGQNECGGSLNESVGNLNTVNNNGLYKSPIHSNSNKSPIHTNTNKPPIHSNTNKSPIHSNTNKPHIHSNSNTKTFKSFNEAVNDFFTNMKQKKPTQLDKKQKIKQKQQEHINSLEDKIKIYEKMAQTLQENETLVNEIFDIHNNVIKYKIDWKDFDKYKVKEDLKNNILSKSIVKSDFKTFICVIRLNECSGSKGSLDGRDLCGKDEFGTEEESVGTEEGFDRSGKDVCIGESGTEEGDGRFKGKGVGTEEGVDRSDKDVCNGESGTEEDDGRFKGKGVGTEEGVDRSDKDVCNGECVETNGKQLIEDNTITNNTNIYTTKSPYTKSPYTKSPHTKSPYTKSPHTKSPYTKSPHTNTTTIEIECNFKLSLYQNITNIYIKRKKLLQKIEKTKYAINNIEIKTFNKEEKQKIKRHVYWFEKFNFFFTTDKKLIIGGKNSQQNEILVKKYLGDDDLYFHSDISGGSSVIVKRELFENIKGSGNIGGNCFVSVGGNCFVSVGDMKSGNDYVGDGNMDAGDMKNGSAREIVINNDNTNIKEKITDTTIEEASLMALCNSQCWEQQIITPVFYVKGEQVSKTPPTGQYVTKGSFIIRGTKTYVNVYKLEYGVGILFKVPSYEIESVMGECVGCSEGCSVGCNGHGKCNGHVKDKECIELNGHGKCNGHVKDKECIELNGHVKDKEYVKCNGHCKGCVDGHLKCTSLNKKTLKDNIIEYEGSYFVKDPKNYEIEFALPLCAPYKVLQDYKYKVRILPGKDKKGKIVQNIMKIFISKGDERVIQKLKLISVEEFCNVLPSNIKIGKEMK